MTWNIDFRVEKSLEAIARDEALLSQEGHKYLPKTPEEAACFSLHEWVMEAIRRAYVMGRSDGANTARAQIRAALGIKENLPPETGKE